MKNTVKCRLFTSQIDLSGANCFYFEIAVVDWLNKSAAVGHVFFIQMGLQNKLPHFLFVKNLWSTQPLFEIKTLAYQIDLDQIDLDQIFVLVCAVCGLVCGDLEISKNRKNHR